MKCSSESQNSGTQGGGGEEIREADLVRKRALSAAYGGGPSVA